MKRLLIRPGAIGDCILSLPALEHLNAGYTEVWVPSVVVPLIGFADRVCAISSTGIDRLEIDDNLRKRLDGFDEIVSWYGANRPEFRAALNAVFHAALPPADCGLHATDFFARQVGAPCGLLPRLPVVRPTAHRSIVIQPFSGSAKKNWPLDRYRALAARLPLPVTWIAGPEEKLEGAQRFDNLRELAGFIAGAALYIGNDSGITHLAAASGAPTLALFSATNPKVWAPRGANVTVLKDAPIDVVLEAANRLLG